MKVLTTIVSRTVFENFLHLGIKSKIVSIFFECSNINDFICSIRVIEAFKPVPKINDYASLLMRLKIERSSKLDDRKNILRGKIFK